MPTKRKHTVDIFPIEPRNVPNQKQESDGPFQAKIKIHKQINKHSFSLITYLFFACLHVIEAHAGEVFNLDELLKSEEFKGFPMIYSHINRRRIISSRCLSIYLFLEQKGHFRYWVGIFDQFIFVKIQKIFSFFLPYLWNLIPQ